jgi:hypothetical protein
MTWTERVTVVRSQLERLDTLCHGIAIREGHEDACNKPATTVIYDREGADIWPACTWHAHRYGGALTLEQVRTALTTGATEFDVDWRDEW